MNDYIQLAWLAIALASLLLLYKFIIVKNNEKNNDDDDARLDALQQQLNKQQQDIANSNKEVVISTLPYASYGAYPYFYGGRGWRGGGRWRRR